MAKLTESYLRGMIKQVMNEMHDMYDDSPEALGNAADLYSMGDLETTIEEIAKELGVNPQKLAAFIEQEQAQADAFDDEMAGYEEDDGMFESRKRKLLKKKLIKETYHQNPPFGGMKPPHDYSKQISDTSSPRNKEFLEFVRRTVYGAKSRGKPSIKVDDLANSHEAFQIIGNGSTHSRAIARGLIKNNYTVKTDADGKEYIQVIDYSKP